MASFNSPFSELLQTNFVPSTLIRNQISDFLDGPESALSGLNAEMARVEEFLADMRQKRDAIQSGIAEHRKLLSSFRRLPDDMLREIFLWCLPSKRNAAMTTVEAPLLLGRVCSRWRSIVYHTPRLWANLHIPSPIPPSSTNIYPHMAHTFRQVWDHFERKLILHSAAVEAWLTRSGSCPLALSFHPREANPVQHDRYVKIYLDIIMKFTDRWCDIQMSVPVGDHSSNLAALQPRAFPLLKHLDLKFACRQTHDKRWPSSGLINAPNLRSLQISYFPQLISSIQMTWPNLTRLSIQDLSSPSRQKRVSLKDAHQLMCHSPKLRYCCIKITDNNDAVSPTEPISLLDLETLVLHEGAWGIGTLFECLDFPSLRKLCFHSSFVPSSTRVAPILTLLERSGSQLEHLITDVFTFTLDDLQSCFSLTPCLTHFTNRVSVPSLSREQSRLRSSLPIGPHLMKAFVNLLTPGYLDMDVWPRLQFIELKDIPNVADVDVSNFIHGRMEVASMAPMHPGDAQIAPLQHVRISFYTDMINDIRTSFDKYKDAGLKVELTYPPARAIMMGMFPSRAGLLPRSQALNVLDDFAAF